MKQLAGLILLLIMLAQVLPAQNKADSISEPSSHFRKSVLASFQMGKVIQTHAFVKGENPNQEAYEGYLGFKAQYGIHTDGRKLWHQLYGYPVWGFGLHQSILLNDYDELGNGTSLYAYFNAPFKRWRKWSLDYDIGFGAAFGWNKHDIIENGYYYPIGTFSTIYFGFSVGPTFQLGKNFDLNASLTYTHYSNGAFKLPNLGLNLWSGNVSLRYVFNERPEFSKMVKPKYWKEWEWIVILSPAWRQVGFGYEDENGEQKAAAFDYPVMTFSSSLNRQLSHLVKFGAGFDVTYNTAYGATMELENGDPQKGPELPVSDQIMLGVYPAFELVINQMSLVVQAGFYIYKADIPTTETPTSYQRVGLKYHLADSFIVGMNIRAYNFSKADFIEWVVGYRIKWQKSYKK